MSSLNTSRGLNQEEYARWKVSKMPFTKYLEEKLEEENLVKKKLSYLAKNKEAMSQKERDRGFQQVEDMKKGCLYKVW